MFKISKRPKLDKICNKYNINVVRCSLTKGKAGLRSALLYYKVHFLVLIKQATCIGCTCTLSKGLL